jgi:hypothetical protein
MKMMISCLFIVYIFSDHLMFGYGATSDEATIPGFTQKKIDEKDFGFDIEVINSGSQNLFRQFFFV